MPDYIKFILVFLIAFVLSFVFTKFIIWLAHRQGILDHPGADRKIHTKPVPLLGGIAVYASFFITIFILWQRLIPSCHEPLSGGCCFYSSQKYPFSLSLCLYGFSKTNHKIKEAQLEIATSFRVGVSMVPKPVNSLPSARRDWKSDSKNARIAVLPRLNGLIHRFSSCGKNKTLNRRANGQGPARDLNF